ncbi:VirB4, partial [Pseudomonas amygdali pv. lachrymans]
VNQFDAQTYRRLAFDCTQLLNNDYAQKHPEVMEAFLNTLFYMKREMHEARPGNLLLNVVAEYWAPLSFKSTADAIQEVLQSGRMRGEILIMDTQYPEQALATKYAPAVIQQVITPIWLPNKNAQAESYAKFGVRGKLFEAVRTMGPLSREMVVQQGHQTVKLKMELGEPLKYWLPLLSATEQNLPVAERIRQHLGTTDPKVWIDAFLVAEAVRQWLNTDDPAVWLPAFDYADNLRQSMNTRDAQRWLPAFQKAWKALQEHNEME